jgi:hypothetical protein
MTCSGNKESAWATITIGCVDTVQAKEDIAQILKTLSKRMSNSRSQPLYYIDFGNSRETGQAILSTIGKIKQPDSKQYRTAETLVFEEKSGRAGRSCRLSGRYCCGTLKLPAGVHTTARFRPAFCLLIAVGRCKMRGVFIRGNHCYGITQ